MPLLHNFLTESIIFVVSVDVIVRFTIYENVGDILIY